MATREQILETSLHLFLQRGCKNLTMDEVASENGISKRTLYEMFKDKSSLLEESIISLHEKKSCLDFPSTIEEYHIPSVTSAPHAGPQ